MTLTLILGLIVAHAGPARPNAIDRVVTAIPVPSLLHATAAALLDPHRLAAAAHLQRLRTELWIVTIALQILTLAYFWQSGTAAHVRDALRRAIRSEFAVRFLFGAILGAIARFAALIPQFVSYRVTRSMDLTSELSRVWALDWILGLIFSMIAVGLLAAVVLWLVDRTHQWYLYTVAGIFAANLLVAFVAPYSFAPIFDRYQPAPQPYAPHALEQRLSPRTKMSRAFIVGLGPSARIVLSDTLLAGATRPEVAYDVAVQQAHLRHRDPLHSALLQVLLIVLGAVIAVFVADRIGFRRDDDALSRLSLVGALLVCAYVVALPVYGAYERAIATRAQADALRVTGDRASAIRDAVRNADQDVQVLCPSNFALWFLSDAPATGTRIALAQGITDPCR